MRERTFTSIRSSSRMNGLDLDQHLPDFLPILGPSLKNKNIIYAFGHQHLGWTLGAITGKIISGIVAGEKTNLDLTPYSSKRFN